MKERLATLISGGGTTMQEIVKSCQSGEIPMNVACVISSNPTAGGIEKARNLGIPEKDIVVVNPNDFRGGDGKVDQEGFGLKILKELKKRGVTVVTQNGWLPHTPEVVIDEFPQTIFNQHPGPVPEFGGKGMYGRRVHAAVLIFTLITKREPWTEAIAQRVAKKYDQGAVVKSEKVDFLPKDTIDALQRRVLPVEHKVQIELLKDVAKGNVKELPVRETIVKTKTEDEGYLVFAKKIARLLYPHG